MKTIPRIKPGKLRHVCLLAALLAGCVSSEMAAAQSPVQTARRTDSFDADWRFLKADAPGAEKPEFNDTGWRQLNVPHDWSIEGPFEEQSPARGAGAFLPAGVGWYRKHFTLPAEAAGKRVFVEFDGVMANSDVWINGRHLGKRPFGYVSFAYELTPHLNFVAGKPNILAVRADNSAQPASRWYAGAGIYRHVRLVTTHPVHVGQWGVFVTTPSATAEQAAVRVQTTLTNQSEAPAEVTIMTTLLDPAGREVAVLQSGEMIQAGQTAVVQHNLTIPKPQLWDIDRAQLYHAVSKVSAGGKVLDDVVTPFGIRQFEFKSDTGFWLNGRNFKLKGVCLHHDASAFGAAVPLRAWERRLEKLRELGVNSLRTAHNPVAPEFLDLCDRMGFLVMDEFFDCWTISKNRHDYHLYFNEWSKRDARDTILRDRNHPSVVLYSVGNEIHDTPREELAKSILKGLVEVCHETDPTRPVTQALFRPNVSHDYDNGLADMLDVIGTNYRDQELLAAWRVKPTRKIIGTEQGHERNTWLACRDNPQHAGQFLWAGIDYLGESRQWPVTSFNAGLLDRTGMTHPRGLERQSWWSERPMVAVLRRIAATESTPTDPGYEAIEWRRRQVLFPDWTPTITVPHEENVEVYSNCEEVELSLNGKSLGAKPRPANGSPRNWRFNFEPGTLQAIGKNGGQGVATNELRTAGKPARIVLKADRPKLAPIWDDVGFIEATVTDENGVLIPGASDLIKFSIAGPGVIAAVDSGSIVSHEPFQASERRAFQGRCFAMVKASAASGAITVTASAPGLASGSAVLEATLSAGTK